MGLRQLPDLPAPGATSARAHTVQHSQWVGLADGPTVDGQVAHGLVFQWEGRQLIAATLMTRNAGTSWGPANQVRLDHQQLPGWVAELAEQCTPRVGVLVTRDPDGETSVQVYEAGVRGTVGWPTAVCPVVDPGAGDPTLAEWRETRDEQVEKARAVSEQMAADLHSEYEAWVGSRWVPDEDETDQREVAAAGLDRLDADDVRRGVQRADGVVDGHLLDLQHQDDVRKGRTS